MRALGFGEDDSLPGRTQPIQLTEGAIQSGEQRLALGVVTGVGCQRPKVAQLLDFLRDGITPGAALCLCARLFVSPFVGGLGERLVVLI